jgi:type IV pilus assembly protein PilA
MRIGFKERSMKRNQQGFTLIELMTVVAVIGVLSSIAIPAYQDYTIRAQVAEGLNLSAGVKVAVVEYFVENGDWPNNNVKAGVANHNDIEGNYAKSVRVNGNEIEIMYGHAAHNAIKNKRLTLSATQSLGYFKWACASAAIKDSHLPSACR